jgi:hypothetical protein
MTAFTLQSLRRGVYPWPVYQATLPDGTTRRMSFWSDGRKPLDFDRGRRLIAMTGDRVAPTDGVVCLPDGTMRRDPHFAPEPTPRVVRKRLTVAAAAKAALAALSQPATFPADIELARTVLRDALGIAA